MPRKTKKKMTKKTYKKSTKSFLSKFNSQVGFPKTTYVKMRYADSHEFSPAVPGVLNTWIFRANSIWDPDQTFVGHQPLGRDQWVPFYEKYVVYRADCTVNFSVRTNNSEPAAIGVYLSSDALITAPNICVLQEQGKSNIQIISPTTNGNAFTTNRRIKMTYNAKKWHNITNVKDAENLEADMGTNPTDETFFVVFYSNADPAAVGTAPVLVANVVINYYVCLKDPKELPRS